MGRPHVGYPVVRLGEEGGGIFRGVLMLNGCDSRRRIGGNEAAIRLVNRFYGVQKKPPAFNWGFFISLRKILRLLLDLLPRILPSLDAGRVDPDVVIA